MFCFSWEPQVFSGVTLVIRNFLIKNRILGPILSSSESLFFKVSGVILFRALPVVNLCFIHVACAEEMIVLPPPKTSSLRILPTSSRWGLKS